MAGRSQSPRLPARRGLNRVPGGNTHDGPTFSEIVAAPWSRTYEHVSSESTIVADDFWCTCAVGPIPAHAPQTRQLGAARVHSYEVPGNDTGLVSQIMILFSDPSQILLPSAVYLTLLILALVTLSFRAAPTSRWHRWRYIFALLFIWAYAMSTPLVANLLIGALESQYAPPVPSALAQSSDNLIVVLASGRVRDTVEGELPHPDEPGWNRTLAGIRLWQRIGGRLLFNGGPSVSGSDAVADRMAELARAAGVPAEAIVVERRARTTYENLKYTKEHMGNGRNRVWLVTSAIHMPRAMMSARLNEVEVLPYPCDFRENKGLGWRGWFPHVNAPQDLAMALHELLGMVSYAATQR